LDQTIFIVIVVAVVAFILIIVIAVCLRRRRKRQTENVTLNKYLPSTNTYVSHPEAIALNESQKDEGGEEIDLQVIENEAVCTKEEIKLQP
jgi:flagellar biosynthesis/type III secretory pathway M-ring protein FliF/YscJ